MKTAEQFLLEYCELDEITPEDVVFTEYIPAMLNAYAEQKTEKIMVNLQRILDHAAEPTTINRLQTIRRLAKQTIEFLKEEA